MQPFSRSVESVRPSLSFPTLTATATEPLQATAGGDERNIFIFQVTIVAYKGISAKEWNRTERNGLKSIAMAMLHLSGWSRAKGNAAERRRFNRILTQNKKEKKEKEKKEQF